MCHLNIEMKSFFGKLSLLLLLFFVIIPFGFAGTRSETTTNLKPFSIISNIDSAFDFEANKPPKKKHKKKNKKKHKKKKKKKSKRKNKPGRRSRFKSQKRQHGIK